LFDKPTSSLDPELVGEVLEIIRSSAADGLSARRARQRSYSNRRGNLQPKPSFGQSCTDHIWGIFPSGLMVDEWEGLRPVSAYSRVGRSTATMLTAVCVPAEGHGRRIQHHWDRFSPRANLRSTLRMAEFQ
jgi:hypothetical protein